MASYAGGVGRKVTRLTLDSLGELPHAATCTQWEFDAVRRAKIAGHEAEEKAAWLSEVLRDWGSVGRVVVVDDEVVGHVEFGPAVFFPGSERFATAPVSPDSVLLATAWVSPSHRGGGLGRMLVQGMARELVVRDVTAVEAFGTTRPRQGDCVLPAEFLSAVGFRTHRPHPVYPRMRMDLRTTLSWREEIETALGKLVGAVSGKRRAPVPHHRSPYS